MDEKCGGKKWQGAVVAIGGTLAVGHLASSLGAL